jgi:hypothetical protein
MWSKQRGLINPSWIGERRLENARVVLGPETGKEPIKPSTVLGGPGKKSEQHLSRRQRNIKSSR